MFKLLTDKSPLADSLEKFITTNHNGEKIAWCKNSFKKSHFVISTQSQKTVIF